MGTEFEEHIKRVVSLVTMVRIASKTQDYDPSVKQIGAMNGYVTKYMLDKKNRKPVLAMLLGRYISTTKRIRGGEASCVISAFKPVVEGEEPKRDPFTKEDVRIMERIVTQSGVDSAEILPFDDDMEIDTRRYVLSLAARLNFHFGDSMPEVTID